MNETSKKNRAVSVSASDIDADAEDDIVATQTVDSVAKSSDAGFGRSMIYTPSQVIGALYFDKKRTLATGLIMAAMSVGALIGPLLCVVLIEIYTWHGTMFILGGMYLQTVAAAAMFRVIPRAAKEELKKRRKDRNTRFIMSITDMIKFGVHCLSNLLNVFGRSILITFCVLLGIKRGMSLTRAAQMLTMLQVSNAISRFLVAAVGDRRWFPRHLVLGFTDLAGFLMGYTGDVGSVFTLSGISYIVSASLIGGALFVDYWQKHMRREPPRLARRETVNTKLEETRSVP
ncbi:PREDICTED: monocarboxylate transporter 12-like [Priapulus caudatus]|uniref:Monocarboxylate transporter 12-like n=1 Tax=Priapulus caudatus TaxID=37621 RepID=A0ABM1FBW5_PRICU|nr:PREDICTED: monocarboxylate transporter 12-like [Priapulus caudatus]